ncbi:MAG: redoxin domain-containing protein [Deltaproteobacteria bacterium]|nr:redoxin domain-containing protein [Deltaproteobacteria bacterium]
MTAVTRWLRAVRERYLHARRRRVVRWSIDALVIALVMIVAGALQTRRHLGAGTAPRATLTTLAGTQVELESFRGKPTLLAFWAPWCGVCKVESQNVSWAMHLAGGAANVVSIAAEFEQVDDVRRFIEVHDADYPVLLGTRRLTEQFAIEGFPTVYFLDADGRVKSSVVGYTSTLGLLVRLFF